LKPYEEHRRAAPKEIKVSIVTVSTSKSREARGGKDVDDLSGKTIRRLVEFAGHTVVSQQLIDDDPQKIRFTVLKNLYEDAADTAILTGGTGITRRDVTIEALRSLFDKELYGFGDVFRNLSYQLIGSPAYLSRATAGIIDHRIIYCLPGSPDAVETAMKIIIYELPHAVLMAHS
jgi:molybdenum cofactor biosynthesis protein B